MFLQFVFIFESFLTMFTSMKVLPMFLFTIFPSTVNFHFFKERKLLFVCYFSWFSRSFCLLKCLLHFWQGLNLLWAWNFKCSSRPYWLLQTFSQVTHLIFLLGFSNFDLILAENEFKLLNILVARQLSGFIRYFFFVWQCALLSLTRIFRAQKYKLEGLRI